MNAFRERTKMNSKSLFLLVAKRILRPCGRVFAWLPASLMLAAQAQVTPTFTNNFFMLPGFPGLPDGTGTRFGEELASLGDGRFLVGSPRMDVDLDGPASLIITDAGFVSIHNPTGEAVASASLQVNLERRFYGHSMSVFPDGRFLVGSGNAATNPTGTFEFVGSVHLHGPGGELLRTWTSPDGVTNQFGFFGGAGVVAVTTNRFAAAALTEFGKVFVYDASAVGPPLAVISNPTPQSADEFAFCLAALGKDRILVGDPSDAKSGVRAGSVMIYDLAGNLVRTVHGFDAKPSQFGGSLATVDDHRFLVGARATEATYMLNGQLVTNRNAGAVYLCDDTGTLLKTFVPPDVSRSVYFGTSIGMLGADRVLIGAPQSKIGQTESGQVHIFTLDGLHLETIDNPAPALGDLFGTALAALDERRFVVSAPDDDTLQNNAGSLYGFDAPAPTLELGAEVPRPNGLDLSGTFPTQGPTVTPPSAAFWHQASQKLFAIRPGAVQVTWPLLNNRVYNWRASVDWPTNATRFQLHVASPSAVDVSDGGTFSQIVLHTTSTDADAQTVSQTRTFQATLPGNSLLMLSSGDPSTNAVRFQLVRTIRWDDLDHLHDNAQATIGQPVADPAGYHDPQCGSPRIVLPGGVFCPAPVFDPATGAGTIIPVNRDNPASSTDDLVVAYVQRGTRLFDPVTGANVPSTICWPYKPVRFAPQWPADAPRLVIASQKGTGEIDPAQFMDWELYVQNDPAQAGFNPNDEHALRRSLDSGDAVFALRDDLGTSETSEPFVLIRYRDPAAGGQWRLKVWQVVAEEAPFLFKHPARAGELIPPLFPLNTLAPAPETTGFSGPYWRDRKLSFWAKAAGADGGTAEIVMHYFYPMQPEFFLPGTNPPPPGSAIPLLDRRAGTPGTPIAVRYEAAWPAAVPELRVGETLVKPKNGLPQIAGQSSVEVLYEQLTARGDGASVELIDPVRIRSVPLDVLPPDVSTRSGQGKVRFPSLPPHLEARLNYDPVARKLDLAGHFVEPPAGESYLLLNVLTARDQAILAAMSPNTAWQNAVKGLASVAGAVLPVTADSAGFDLLALTAGNGHGTGYVTLAFGNSTNLSAPAEPISLSVIQVTCPLYRGELKVIPSPNPLAEQLTLRHSGDFAGRPGDFEFEWRTQPPADGLPSTLPPEKWARFQPAPATGIGAVDITIAGPGLYTLSDNYFVCRYRRVAGVGTCGSDWSDWTPPMLAEGWIKRVLAGIDPFEQRIKNYQDTQVNTIVSMISQAGTRAFGDVALNLDAVNQAGLIEVYETVLGRGMSLSIEGAQPVDYAPANDALLLAAGRLADLYMLLGNEAYADAADPTIAFGTDDGVYGSQATSLHCFMNQTESLLEEELALLRGRDSSKLPSVETHPVYNRLIWNFTRDITGGEVAYALNYNIRNADGDVSGSIDEADARLIYPQGHGDAWGHYLTAIKNYYRLLRNTNFTWVPRAEAVVVGGVPVSVDYLDERKFATAAAARARTGAEIVSLTARASYVENPAQPWQTRPDPDGNRAWGLGDWASRAGQGAFFDWLTANAILPDTDPNTGHTGIQKIERANIRELADIAEGYRQIQEQADEADQGRNPLGLASNVVPFDIDPSAIASGKTHFEQINERANEALKNAVAVFDFAHASTQLLRRQADDADEFQRRVTDGEADFNNRLIEIFGTPYSDDMGPGGTYPAGYNGPDIYHYDYVDDPEIQAEVTSQQPTLRFDLSELTVAASGALGKATRPVVFHFSPNGFGLTKPSTWTGQRSAPGEIQITRSALMESLRRLERGVVEYENLVGRIVDASESLAAERNLNLAQLRIRQTQLDKVIGFNEEIAEDRGAIQRFRGMAEAGRIATDFAFDAIPTVVGLANDAFSIKRALLRAVGRAVVVLPWELEISRTETDIQNTQDKKNEVAALAELQLFTNQTEFNDQERLRQLEQLLRTEPAARLELETLAESQKQATARYQATLARAIRLLEERTRFRQQTAAQIQGYRYKDMAFRVFRSDALQKYRAQFDLAARYVYLAAKAYDYETCLAPGDNRGPGSGFLTSIIRARSLGLFSNGSPLPRGATGDPGLSDPLARMTANWALVLKGQLGFNNPQTETGRFSLRNELFRVLTGPGGNERWRETLERYIVPNVLEMPEFRRHCIPFSPVEPVEPALVIPFGTTINFGMNFFGWPAGGGDNDYDSTKFATKVRSVGVWFANYNNLGGGMINTPRVYLVPVGLDVMRAPSQGAPYVREWRILDQALPVPFPLGATDLNKPSWIPMNDTLSEDFAAIRRLGRFRAFHDSGNFNPSETISDSRLIGRSVWNTRWLLIIPAGALHTDRNEGIQRFIHGALRPDGTRDGNGVSDIKVFFQTYAYSGN
ncbi:MAG: hypothetical protein AB9869_16375 [Verrucomicrobiia bacterium]